VRTIHTYILRLLVDAAEPDALRGALQPVPEGQPQPFVGEQELLALLRGVSLPTDEKLTSSGPPSDE
jgi:hypothetical protein